MTRLLPILLFCACLTVEAQRDYWVVSTAVNPAASDSNNAVTSNTAWANWLKVRDPGAYGITFNPGDRILSVGLWDCAVGGLDYTIHTPPLYGTSNAPIIITNGGGIGCTFSNSAGAGANQLLLNGAQQWVIVGGITFTNGGAQGPSVSGNCQNIEICYDSFGGCDPIFQWLNSGQGLFHHDVFANSLPFDNGPHEDGGGHGLTLGEFYNSPADASSNVVVVSNVFIYGGHDLLSIYASNCVDRWNTFINPPWWDYSFPSIPFLNDGSGTTWNINVLEDGRAIEKGGLNGHNILSEHETILGCAAAPDGPGAFTESGFSNIDRSIVIVGAAANAVQLYGKGGGAPCCSNWIYDITLGWAGEQQFFNASTHAPVYYPYAAWQNSVSFNNTSNNWIFNVLDYNSFESQWRFSDGFGTDVAWMAGCLTNTVNPSWVSPNYNPSNFTLTPVMPDLRLLQGSAALGTGKFITTANGGATASTTLIVNSNTAGFYVGNVTACNYTVSNDFVQFQGQTATAQIVSISGNTLTLATPLTWVDGQSLTLPYNGAGPDIGALSGASGLSIIATGPGAPITLSLGSATNTVHINLQ